MFVRVARRASNALVKHQATKSGDAASGSPIHSTVWRASF